MFQQGFELANESTFSRQLYVNEVLLVVFIIQRSKGCSCNATHHVISRHIATHQQLLILPKHSLCDMDMLKFYYISTFIYFPPMYTSIPFEARLPSHVATHLACTMQTRPPRHMRRRDCVPTVELRHRLHLTCILPQLVQRRLL